mmetsp:Transcript_20852/g.52961  ORF Transcript_20852/g.52961 Transcript_20852/m.52961 type:complete len:231 (-) Transcript_20852:636-1328(-)
MSPIRRLQSGENIIAGEVSAQNQADAHLAGQEQKRSPRKCTSRKCLNDSTKGQRSDSSRDRQRCRHQSNSLTSSTPRCHLTRNPAANRCHSQGGLQKQLRSEQQRRPTPGNRRQRRSKNGGQHRNGHHVFFGQIAHPHRDQTLPDYLREPAHSLQNSSLVLGELVHKLRIQAQGDEKAELRGVEHQQHGDHNPQDRGQLRGGFVVAHQAKVLHGVDVGEPQGSLPSNLAR